MKKTIALLSVILIFTFSYSCKKKKTEEPAPASTTNIFTPPAQPYSILQTAYRYANYNNVVSLDSTVLAAFFESPIGASSSINYVNAGNVSLNDSNLYLFSGIYSNSVAINISNTVKWNVTGSGTVTPFTFSYTASYPKYSGGNFLPDTCYKSSGISLTISGVTNTSNGVSVLINQSPNTISKYLSTPNGVVNIAAAELSAFTTNTPLYIELSFSNYKQQTFGGVLHQFNNDVTYHKVSYLK